MAEPVIEVKSPLQIHVERRERAGERAVRARLADAFLEHGWEISRSVISYWCSGARMPNFQSQQRLEAVTYGAVTPVDWLAYRQRLHDRAQRTNGRRRRPRQG